MLQIVIAEAKQHDLALIYSSWLDGFRRAPMYSSKTSPHYAGTSAEYYASQHPAITEMLARSKVLVARPVDWDEGVVAWVCGEQLRHGFVLHGAYTKSMCRGQGFARRLVEALQPSGRMMYSAYRPPYTRGLDAKGWKHEPGAFPARKKEKTA